ncbi:hypothetical protein EGW08_009549 [Elysia chlorotica]|uniref:LolA-like domain-containing protein n=1 Tax=Elysia chlorotica TaxID=188477 RepID=A0A3S1BK63_ELYCH|nr:hypothetical protein EGW08_009549 [Elysia chlorotica]
MKFFQACCSLLLFFQPSVAQVNFDTACATINTSTANKTRTTNIPDFPKIFSAIAVEKELRFPDEEITSTSEAIIEFSEPSGQMFFQRETNGSQISVFVDSEQNVCLSLRKDNGQCVKTEQPCNAITGLEHYVRLKEGEITLKSARAVYWFDTRQLDTAIKLGKSQTRGMDSIAYMACKEENNITVVTQWYFLDTSKIKSANKEPVLLAALRLIEGKNSKSYIRDWIDVIDFKPIQSDNVRSNMDVEDVGCISDNSKSVKKEIPKPPATFSCVIETHVVRAGRNDRDIDVEAVRYNYDDAWFHSDERRISLDPNSGNATEVEKKIIEDFFTGIRYEMSKSATQCAVSPTLSRAGSRATDGKFIMKSPTQFWDADPDTAVYLGEAVIRGVPCDAWRVGLQDASANGNTTNTLFLASPKWLRRRRLPENSFFPVQFIERGESGVRFHSYFDFKEKFSYFVPDVSPCFNTSCSENVRMILQTSFYKSIKSSPRQFERNFRKAVLDLAGMESALQVTKIMAKASLFVPFQTQVTFKILSRFKISSNSIVDEVRVTHDASVAVAKIKNAIVSGLFQLTQVIKSKDILIKARRDSFSLLKFEYQTNDEESSYSGFTVGTLIGLTIAALIVGAVVGLGAVYSYKRWSDKKFQEVLKSGKAPSTTNTDTPKVSDFGMLEISTEEVQ